MTRTTILVLALALGLSGCARLAESRFNPLNWFGNSRVETPADPAERRPLVPENRRVQVVDGRVLVDQIAEMSVDRSPYGAIVSATGVPATQGYFNAQLIPREVENGVLTLEFRAEAPAGFEGTGNARSRAITAAFVIGAADLPGIRRVRVVGAQNSRIASR